MYLKKINLKNKYALVTGAGKGLGRACSIAMAEAGATIIGLSRTSSDLDKLEKDIKKVKSKLIKINCDVMDYKDLSKKLKKIKIIDILVNNAGTNIPEPFDKVKQESLKYENRDHALYIAFAPYKDPRYSISVLVEHGGSGSKAAAPLASKLIKKIIDRHKLREQIRKGHLTTV